jgi:hypothetical protein
LAQSDFERRAKQWLSDYKLSILNVQEDGSFTYRGHNLPYAHILPRKQYNLIILPSFRQDFWGWFSGQDISLNQYFHHLNSSQALCFNLFFPLLTGNGRGLAALLCSLGILGFPAPGAAFEFKAHDVENTHFDFMIPLQSTGRVHFEVKYTEAGFGVAKADTEHLAKFQTLYTRLADRFEKSFCCESHSYKKLSDHEEYMAPGSR